MAVEGPVGKDVICGQRLADLREVDVWLVKSQLGVDLCSAPGRLERNLIYGKRMAKEIRLVAKGRPKGFDL